jgi:hypothetical protein
VHSRAPRGPGGSDAGLSFGNAVAPTVAVALAQDFTGRFLAQFFESAGGAELSVAWQADVSFRSCFLPGVSRASRLLSLAHQEYFPAIELLLEEKDGEQSVLEGRARFPEGAALDLCSVFFSGGSTISTQSPLDSTVLLWLVRVERITISKARA